LSTLIRATKTKLSHAAVWLLQLSSAFPVVARSQQQGCPKVGQRHGAYSNLSVTLCFQDADKGARHLEIASPNGAIQLVVDGNEGKFTQNGESIGGPFLIANDSEIIWSPDSRAILLTFRLGGLGPVKTGVLYVHPEASPNASDITKLIQKEFFSRHPDGFCSKDVNVGALSWDNSSQKAVLIAEVPSSSSCGDMLGYFEAYEVAIPEGRVLARYSQKDTVKRWRKILAPDILAK
jgi:hypothetical protein